MEKLMATVLLMKSIYDVCVSPAKTAAIYLITHMLKRSCHFRCNLFFRLRHLQQQQKKHKTNTLFPSCKNPSPISKARRRRRHVKLACLHNLPRRLFLTIWMQSQSASPPTARRRSARVVLQPYHSCRRAPGFKTQQSDGLSLTPSCLSVSHSASILHPPPSNLLHAHTSTPSLRFILIFFLFHLHSLPLRSCSPDSWIFQSSHIHSTLHHQFVTKVEFHPFIFRLFFSFIYFILSPGCHHPSLPLPSLPPLTQPICLFYLLADSGVSILSRL